MLWNCRKVTFCRKLYCLHTIILKCYKHTSLCSLDLATLMHFYRIGATAGHRYYYHLCFVIFKSKNFHFIYVLAWYDTSDVCVLCVFCEWRKSKKVLFQKIKTFFLSDPQKKSEFEMSWQWRKLKGTATTATTTTTSNES